MRPPQFKKSILFLLMLLLSLLAAQTSSGKNKTITNKLGMTFVLIPAGKFVMGSPETEPGRDWNEMLHTVTISKSFYMQETEVTQGQWNALVEENPSAFKDCGAACPMDTVSWNQCMQFISFLNQYEKTTKYRLPTEAEWEYACRAGTTTTFYGGNMTEDGCTPVDPVLDAIAWYCGNSGYKNPPDLLRPHPVKTKELFDKYEWLADTASKQHHIYISTYGLY
ncbi:Putative sulfatase modifying factor 1 (fragment) [Desulfamplus magnetovallimortis]|uniref:Putative sulfatase modifying factor 1 n=1 Tax=Desulfamplus magnetovallimortis TaxID=1246637 RepID=A0A1W1H9Q9_9BACT